MSTAPTFPVVFPSALGTLQSSANSPESIATIFAQLVAQIFGYSIIPKATAVTIGNSAGSDYAVGDGASINGLAGSLVRVASVGIGGVVTGLTLVIGGQCTAVANNLPTTTLSGSGVGLTVNVTAFLPVSILNDKTNPFWTVRVGWQQQGQPAWTINDDVCIITAYTDDDPYSRVSDEVYVANDNSTISHKMAYTQVWKMHFVNYGPNAFTNGGLIVAAMSLGWVHNFMAAENIYSVTNWKRPVYVPELKDGQWWDRADVELRFNEGVNLSIVEPSASSVGITLVKENGLHETVNVSI